MHNDNLQQLKLNDSLIREFWKNVFFYHEVKASGVPFDELLNAGLNVFLNLDICKALSLFLLDTESFEFRHKVSLPALPEEKAESFFRELVDNGLIAKSISRSDIVISAPTKEKNNNDVLIIPLISFTGVVGFIVVELGIPAFEMELQLLNLFKMYSGHLAAEIKLNSVQNELGTIRTSFENEFTRKVNGLVQSKMEIMKILDSLQTGIFIIDQNSNQILDANQVARKMLGIPKQLLIGTERNRYCSCCRRKEKSECGLCTDTSFAECSIINADGTSSYIIRKVLPIKLGDNEEYFLESFMDITERRLAELELQKLKESLEEKVAERTASLHFINELLRNEIDENKKLFLAVEQSPVAILISDAGWCTEYVNPSFTNLTGYSLKEILGDMPPLLKNDIADFQLQKDLVGVVVGGREWKQEILSRKKDGGQFWSVVTASALRDDEGNLSHYIFMQEDISERKIMQDNLKKAKEKAESSAKIKSEFLSLMSHEIRTPVNTMMNFASLLKMELNEHMTPEIENGFNMLTNGGLRLIRTVEMIISMAEVQTEGYEARFENMDLNSDIITGNLTEFESTARAKKIQFNYTNKTESAMVKVDGYSALQIILHLLDNAVKFTKRGGVDVQLFNDENKNVVFKVKDTGVGISEEFIPKLFTPFSQEEGGYTRRFEGNGLGLALVKKYCDLNNASIEVQSHKDHGTAFTVTFKPAASHL
ncbi:MAG: PAS domain S-box protein [Ignavibacteria bacterium]|jgi:PAS domain S-box-containing protein|nr:PAS domain S-box protein [Ignavibacteria bacterium]